MSRTICLFLTLAGCEGARGHSAPRVVPPGWTCDEAHAFEERVHVIHTYQQNESENFRVFETCLPVRRADGSVYKYDWAAYRAP